VITNCKEKIKKDLYDYAITIPSCGYLTALLAVVPFQLLALEIGILRGNAVDFPRNIAK
jgi:glucosamine 6-phosphate synthetase-like amidotransferase/phosphosugar isomerase protein